MSEHLIPSWWWCLGRLWNLWEVDLTRASGSLMGGPWGAKSSWPGFLSCPGLERCEQAAWHFHCHSLLPHCPPHHERANLQSVTCSHSSIRLLLIRCLVITMKKVTGATPKKYDFKRSCRDCFYLKPDFCLLDTDGNPQGKKREFVHNGETWVFEGKRLFPL